jgi:hypothetical protein
LSATALRVGLISDTHGLLRPEALAAMDGCDHIVHAGDIGGAAILAQLARLAPVSAVRGNNDHGAWAQAIPESDMVKVGEAWIYVVHDLAELDIDPAAAGVDVVVAGHSHKPVAERRDGVLFVNPGSAGPRRFTLPISVGYLMIEGRAVQPRLVTLEGR